LNQHKNYAKIKVGDSMAKEVVVTAKKLKKRENFKKYFKIVMLCSFLLLIITFLILSIIYNGGKFTVTLDPNFALQTGIVIYEDHEYKEVKGKLYAEDIDFMDNISIDWLPKNIDSEKDGSHNGPNYIAYTFYVENEGNEVQNYWYSVIIDDVIKNVDEAVRIMIFRNDDKKVYAKTSAYTGKAEEGTIEFYSDKYAVLEGRNDFKPGDIDKITVVIWLEGDDPECVDALIGGEIKMHMEIREEHVEQTLEGENNESKESKPEKENEDSSNTESSE